MTIPIIPDQPLDELFSTDLQAYGGFQNGCLEAGSTPLVDTDYFRFNADTSIWDRADG